MTAFPDNLTVDWYKDGNIINTTTVVGSSVHALVLDSVSVNSSGLYTCAVSGFTEGNEVQLNVFTGAFCELWVYLFTKVAQSKTTS